MHSFTIPKTIKRINTCLILTCVHKQRVDYLHSLSSGHKSYLKFDYI